MGTMSEQPTVVIVRLPHELAREVDRRRNAEPDVQSRGEYIANLIAEAFDEKTLLAHLMCSERLHVCDLGISARHSILRRAPDTKATPRKKQIGGVGGQRTNKARTAQKFIAKTS